MKRAGLVINRPPFLFWKKNNKTSYLQLISFRPISILNAFSKLLEKFILVKLNRFATTDNWFSPRQQGFRAGLSTESTILTLTSLIESNKKKKIITCCAFLDINLAFDAAWHHAVLKSLIKKNFPVILVKFIVNFPRFRSWTLSSPLASFVTEIELGCPQRSVLSLFLWNKLLEDLLRLGFPFSFCFIAFTDDIVICTMNKDFNLANSNLQSICDAVVAWSVSVKLIFNGTKSIFMTFSSNRYLPPLSLVDNSVPTQFSDNRFQSIIID